MEEEVKKVKKAGRPPKPAPEQAEVDKMAEEVEKMAKLGMTHAQISAMLGISQCLFRTKKSENNKLSDAYDRGRASSIYGASKSLSQKIEEGDLKAIMFYLKTQAGWSETKIVDNRSSDDSMSTKHFSNFYKQVILKED